MTSATILEQLEAIETLLPVSFAIEETTAGDIMFDIETPYGILVRRRPDQ